MSKKYNILLVCAGGMSTSLLVTKMKQAAEEQRIEVKIQAMAEVTAKKYIFEEKVDLVMLGPQIRFEKASFEEKLKNMSTKLAIIDMADYGSMDGEKVLNTAVNLLEA
ncbi:PTS sugar transporter subunit IIB [Enterococcus gallinarum]|uniref:PTS sugar transporter subunit IIB n=1 Tax=Enterococcus gallinarum TaxID=1353 RepID=UPI003918AE82